jgi:hypothetical protein
MFDMRNSDDADGESRMIGSGRRTLGFIESEVLFATLEVAGC